MEVYNDFNGDLTNLFCCVKNRTMALLLELGFLPLNTRDDFNVLYKFFSREEFTDDYLDEEMELTQRYLEPPDAETIRRMMLERAPRGDVRRAADYFKLIRYSFSGGAKSFAGKSCDIRRFFHLVWECSRRLAEVVIENKDCVDLIRQYDREDAFFYSQATRLTVMNACMDRIEAVLAQPELPDRGREALPKAGSAPEVEFRNVTFAYGEKEVLHDVSFTLERNRMLALVGPSGGGKSTVANLLSRFWDVKQGQILVRGRDIRDIPLSDLMDQISMVFQRVYLFQDTVYNNIAMGRTDATREEVYEAARKARCYDFIMELPDGFDTVIGEGGASLSGGERQRISIARCILKDAPIVILDEATASVDADNESYIQEAITQLCRGKTLLVIAHRLNTIRHADEILVIDQGRIVQAGDHDTLMAEEGIYRRFITARSNPTGWCR